MMAEESGRDQIMQGPVLHVKELSQQILNGVFIPRRRILWDKKFGKH